MIDTKNYHTRIPRKEKHVVLFQKNAIYVDGELVAEGKPTKTIFASNVEWIRFPYLTTPYLRQQFLNINEVKASEYIGVQGIKITDVINNWVYQQYFHAVLKIPIIKDPTPTPSEHPTSFPTFQPTPKPTTLAPTSNPTQKPTQQPTLDPTQSKVINNNTNMPFANVSTIASGKQNQTQSMLNKPRTEFKDLPVQIKVVLSSVGACIFCLLSFCVIKCIRSKKQNMVLQLHVAGDSAVIQKKEKIVVT